MKPVLINGDVWRVVGVAPDSPLLVDREGKRTVGTTDPTTRTINISTALVPPMLDRVLMHEIAHAVTMSHGLLERLHSLIPRAYWIPIEEWAVQLVEVYGIETATLAAESLGRPVCVKGWCHD